MDYGPPPLPPPPPAAPPPDEDEVVPLELACPPAARPEPGCANATEVESASTAASTIFVIFMLLSFC
jgi:hypothetical protein